MIKWNEHESNVIMRTALQARAAYDTLVSEIENDNLASNARIVEARNQLYAAICAIHEVRDW